MLLCLIGKMINVIEGQYYDISKMFSFEIQFISLLNLCLRSNKHTHEFAHLETTGRYDIAYIGDRKTLNRRKSKHMPDFFPLSCVLYRKYIVFRCICL